MSIIRGNGKFLGEWDDFFIPGYFIGFVLGFVGGNSWAVIGQGLTLWAAWGIIYVTIKVTNELYRKVAKRQKKNPKEAGSKSKSPFD